MDTWQAINTVRVVRRFTDQPVAPEHLDGILNAGRRAGSSKNQQSWAFVTIADRQQLRLLAEVGRYADHLAGAPVAIALVRPDASGEHELRSIMWDLGRAAQNMVLAAWELGIGSVPATVYDLALASRLLDCRPIRNATSSCRLATRPTGRRLPRQIAWVDAGPLEKWCITIAGEPRPPAANHQRAAQAPLVVLRRCVSNGRYGAR